MKKILTLFLALTLLCSALVLPAGAKEVPGSTAESTVQEASAPTRAAAAWDNDGDGVLSVLAIGNSFSVDALQYFWNIARSLGISKVTLGNLYIGGCSLNTHVSNVNSDSAAYTYYFNDSGTWKSTKSYKISTAVKSRSWDFISMQQASGDSGVESTYSKLGTLISKVKGYMGSSAKTKLVWHMTWAYQKDSTHSAFSTYNKNQTTMYNAIVTAVTNKIKTNTNFDRIIPNGTAVQNMRSSYVGDTLTRDGYHMSYDQGRFLTALMFVKSITGLDVAKNTYRPDGVSDTYAYVAVNAVNKAYSAPLKISKSVYSGNNPSSGYIELQPKLTKGGYWNCTSTTYNTIITTASNSPNFYCTPRMTKAELPVGTIILVSSGWKYRPEGWITDAKQTGREDATTDKLVVVTENWWKSYTLRAFNISKTDGSALSSVSASTIRTNFRIFVPESTYLKDHVQLKPDLHKGAYWHPQKAGAFNVPITTASNSPNFFCTPRFTKSQLPVGSVIIVKSGYQYRPDGWVTDALQTGTREAVTTQYSTIVDSSWWGSYTIRGFNISLTAGGAITDKTQDDIYKNFKIYVPKSSHSHTAASSTVTAPTCTAGGYTTYTCGLCKQTYTGAQTAALGHSFSSVVTPPTCTESGYTTQSCSRCNQVTKGEETPALGHDLTSVVTPPTCTEKGYTTYTCKRCSQVTTGDEIPALNHAFTSVLTPATCTEGGYTTFTCGHCGFVKTGEETAPLGHDYVETSTPPTCTQDGSSLLVCSRCKDEKLGTPTPSTGHSYEKTVVAPDCHNGGYTLNTCTLCGDSFKSEETAPLGHDLSCAPVDDKLHIYTCSRCSYTAEEAHSFHDGLCSCGREEDHSPILVPEMKISHSLNLAGDISVNLVVSKSLLTGFDLSTVYMEVEIQCFSGNSETEARILTLRPTEQGNYYYFTLEGLTAVQMNDRIRSVLYGTKDSRLYYSATDEYSIATYAYSQLNKLDASHSLKQLCADLLRYGSCAQIYKNYRTDALADSSMTLEDTLYLSNINEVSFGNTNQVLTDLAQPQITWVGKALELNSKVSLKFIFDLGSYTGSLDALELRVTYTDRLGQAQQGTVKALQAYGTDDKRYSFTFDGLLAAELRTVVSAQIFAEGQALSCTLQYSADTYGNNKTGTLATLCKALFAYSDSAKAYFPGNH
ncbi:MAG: DUF4886 domain-containing protein [Oscillospiraceae bacterium]|nr:DUF4886 domain-containing protein [Oscillospiraceae bacterium]